jgi:hypothetical protein
MIINNNHFQSIKLSNEISKFKLIPNMIKIIGELNKKLNFEDNEDIIISIKYGKRIVINCSNSNLKKMNYNDFIEIVDYNPIKKVLLLLGPNHPDFNMTLHWIIQSARRDTNVLVQLISNPLTNKLMKNNEKQIKNNSIEISKDILIKFRNSNIAIIKNHGIFIIANNINEVNSIINKLIEEK